jgi:uroporphyrinogen-III synthase
MSLHGLTVMVTRPKPQGEDLCDIIREQHGAAIYFPTIEIIPSRICDENFAKLDQYDMVIFVSLQSVYQTAKKIQTLWPIFPAHTQVLAIGESTADALKNANLPILDYPKNEWNSEALLGLPILGHVQGKKIAIIRGETGRELIENTLIARGALVDNVIAYRRVMPKIDVQSYQNLVMTQQIDIIICTSNEILQNLTTLLDVQQVPLMVISERMLGFAKELGFKHLFLAKNASHDAMISELVKQKDQLCQMKKTQT